MPRSFTSKVLRTMRGSDSVRATIPEPIAALLGVEDGSELVWTVEPGTGRVWVSSTGGGKSSKHR